MPAAWKNGGVFTSPWSQTKGLSLALMHDPDGMSDMTYTSSSSLAETCVLRHPHGTVPDAPQVSTRFQIPCWLTLACASK